MILTTLFLISVFVTCTALCSRGSFQWGLIVGNADATWSSLRIAFNLIGQIILVFGIQLAFMLGTVSSFANAGPLYALVIVCWCMTFIVTVAVGVLGYVTGQKDVEALKADLSSPAP
jgi:hypothetical protein